MIGCRDLRGLEMLLKATKIFAQVFLGDNEVNNSEVEHEITKLEITSVKTGLCYSRLVSPTGKAMTSDVFWLS